jgi:hypothetical protein
MKLKTIFIAAAIVISPAAFAEKDDHTPKHGGMVVEGTHLDFEIVTKADVIQVYVQEHGKKVSLDGAKGKMTLLSTAGKSDVDLVPAGDKMEAKGSFKIAKGTKGVVSVTLADKPAATARFDVK